MMAKRVFDVVVSCLALVVLSPLLAAIAVAVRVDSPGPAFFRQERVGRFGAPFQILKFRTMAARRDDAALPITVAGDPRITRVGKILRRFKLDELPQLFNVARGEMSIVGPRPELLRYVELYPPEKRRIVLSLRPGITDNAAIEFVDEEQLLAGAPDPEKAYVEIVMPRKLDLYEKYAVSRSFWGDLRIVARTACRIVARSSGSPRSRSST